MKTSEYLDLAKRTAKVGSDNELARQLNWGKSQINNYRHNRQAMDNKQALEIAELLDIPVWQVIADMEIQRAERADDISAKKKWAMLAKMTAQRGMASTSLLISLSFFSWAIQKCILCKITDEAAAA